jgi:hypothetical protein
VVTEHKNIPEPSVSEVKKYLALWNREESSVPLEKALETLFTKTWVRNDDMDGIIPKVCTLDKIYATNLFKPFNVAKRILDLKIDKRLEKGDLGLVNEIAKVTDSNGKTRDNYSFATKYCSFHRPLVYPIFDNNVRLMLTHFKNKDGYCKFTQGDLRCYPKFVNIIEGFQKKYGLTQFSFKKLDHYLWMAGKEYFGKGK